MRRIALWAFAVGVLAVATIGSDWFWLCAYGKGGSPEYKGRLATFDSYFPPGSHYILFNHGDVTVVSPHYWRLIGQAAHTDLVVDLSALPFLLVGLFAYWRQAEEAKGFYGPFVKLWGLLFLPRPADPLITKFAKAFFLMDFAGLSLFHMTSLSVCSEPEFLHRVLVARVVEALAAAAITGSVVILHRWFRLRGVREE